MVLSKVLLESRCDLTTSIVAIPHSSRLGIRAGKYSIDAPNYRKFLNGYVTAVTNGAANLAEVPSSTSPLRLDVDIKTQLSRAMTKVVVNNVKSNNDAIKPLYDENDLGVILSTLQMCLDETLIDNANKDDSTRNHERPVYVLLTKPPRLVGVVNDAVATVKHGFHIHVPNVWLDNSTHSTIVKNLREALLGEKFKCGVEYSSAIDDVVKKPWLMYGSTKDSGQQPYVVSNAYSVFKSSNDNDVHEIVERDPADVVGVITIADRTDIVDFNSIPDTWTANGINDCGEDALKAWVYILSIRMNLSLARKYFRRRRRPHNDTKDAFQYLQIDEYADKNGGDDGDGDDDDDDDDNSNIDKLDGANDDGDVVDPFYEDDGGFHEDLRHILMSLDDSRAENYESWRNVMYALIDSVHNNKLEKGRGLQLFDEFSARSVAKYNKSEVSRVWNNEFTYNKSVKRIKMERPITIKTILMYLKEDNYDAWQQQCMRNRTRSRTLRPLHQNASVARGYRRAAPATTASTSRRQLRRSKRRKINLARDDQSDSETDDYESDDEAYLRSDYGVLNKNNASDETSYHNAHELFTDAVFENVSAHDIDIASTFMQTWGDNVILSLHKVLYKYNGTVWRYVQEEGIYLRRELSKWIVVFAEQASLYVDRQRDAEVEDSDAEVELPSNGSRRRKKPSGPSARIKFLTKTFASIESKCKNYTSQGRIVMAIISMVTAGAGDGDVVYMDDNENLLAFEDKVFDRESLTIRSGHPSDMISRHLKCKYVPYKQVDVESREFVVKFFNDLFPNREVCDYFLFCVSQLFRGQNIFKHYYMWTGVGSNGKSLCIKLFEVMLGRLFTKLNKAVLVSSKTDPGAASPDLVRLHGVRMAVTDELVRGDSLNIGQVKLLSGDDTFPARDLFQRAENMMTIKSQFLPIIVCNDLPRFREPDEAAWRRDRVIPFESYFAFHNEANIPSTVDPKHIKLRDLAMTAKLKKHMHAFASFLLKTYVDFEKVRRGSPLLELQLDNQPSRIQYYGKMHRLQQNVVRIILDSKYRHDPSCMEVLPFEKMCSLVNDRANKDRPRDLQEVINFAMEIAEMRNYTVTSEGFVGMVQLA